MYIALSVTVKGCFIYRDEKMKKGNILGLRKKYVDLKGREVSFNLNKIPKPMDDIKFN